MGKWTGKWEERREEVRQEIGANPAPKAESTPEEPLEVAVANDQWEQGQEQIRLLRSIRNYVALAFWLTFVPALLLGLIYLANR
jgi:hypothetical protein